MIISRGPATSFQVFSILHRQVIKFLQLERALFAVKIEWPQFVRDLFVFLSSFELNVRGAQSCP